MSMATCEVRDLACDSKKNPRPVPTVRCPRCGRTVCLSCSLNIEVRLGFNNITLGMQRLCHDCVTILPRVDAWDQVRRHLVMLTGRSDVVPSPRSAPDPTKEYRDALRDAAARAEREAVKRQRKASREATQPAPTKFRGVTKLTQREDRSAPARPRPAPKALMEILGYGK